MMLMAVVLAGNSTHAKPVSRDARMKALLTGKWVDDCGGTAVFQSDGKWAMGADDTDPYWKWDIQKGELLQIWPERGMVRQSFTILFLTKHQFLAQANFHYGNRYIFLTRPYDEID